jgi:hypothetical protein
VSSFGSAPVAGAGGSPAGARPFFDAVSPVPSAYADPSQLAPGQQAGNRTAKVYNQLLDSLILYNGTGNPQTAQPAVGPVPIVFYAAGSMANAAALLGGMIGPTPTDQLGQSAAAQTGSGASASGSADAGAVAPLIFQSADAASAAAVTGGATLDLGGSQDAGASGSNPLQQLLLSLWMNLLTKILGQSGAASSASDSGGAGAGGSAATAWTAVLNSYDSHGQLAAGLVPAGSLINVVNGNTATSATGSSAGK